MKEGVIHGRFQGLHNDHLRYLLSGYERCDHLIVGITNPEPLATSLDNTDNHRHLPEANPFTYYERQLMIRAALRAAGVQDDEFSVVPLPINFPDRYRYYVPLDAVFFLTIYDSWGERKLKLFKSQGLKTEVMWQRPIEDKGLTGSDLRHRIISGLPWTHMVPKAVAPIIEACDLRARIHSTL